MGLFRYGIVGPVPIKKSIKDIEIQHINIEIPDILVIEQNDINIEPVNIVTLDNIQEQIDNTEEEKPTKKESKKKKRKYTKSKRKVIVTSEQDQGEFQL